MSISAAAIAEVPPADGGMLPLYSRAGNRREVDLRWLEDVIPEVYVTPPKPPTGRLDDPTPPVHDASRYA